MQSGLHLTILTPTQKLVDEIDVNELYVYTTEGVLAVMPGYAPIVTNLATGVVTYTKDNISGVLKTSGGVLRVENTGKVTVLADIAEKASDINLERAQKSLERAESRLASGELSESDRARTIESKERAQARIEAVELFEKLKY